MGVIYKLKQEMVDFILTEKKAHSALSCRKLVDIIREKFQMEISKSAINQVIKNASLSNPVGRTPLPDKKTRRFKIPEQKKMIPQEEKLILDVNARRVLYDGMGAFFLKAAQWQLDCFPILGRMMSKHTTPNLTADINITSEVLLLSPIFGIMNLEHFKTYNRSGLWAVNGLDGKMEYETLANLVNGLISIKDLSLTISNEIPQVFCEVGFIKISLENKNSILLDTEFRIIKNLENVQSVYTISIKKLFNEISKRIITNVHSAILVFESTENEFSNQFSRLIAAFENLPENRMERLSLLDENQQELTLLASIPHKKRYFILILNPAYLAYINHSFVSNSHLFEFNYRNKIIKSLEKELIIPKNSILNQKIPLRLIHFQEEASREPFGAILITNMEKKHPPQKILQEYLMIRLNLEEKSKRGYENTKIPFDFYTSLLNRQGLSFVEGKSPDLWTNIIILLNVLNRYCQRHFFPEAYANFEVPVLIERFYQLPGYLDKDSQSLKISLKPNDIYPYRQDLEYAIEKLNSSHILDHSGKRLIMSIER